MMHFPLLIYAETYSMVIKEGNNLSPDITHIYQDLMSKKDIIWGGIADVNIGELVLSDTLQMTLDNERGKKLGSIWKFIVL